MSKKANEVNKVSFAVILGVKKANPNGDPSCLNIPRTNSDNFGIISDVCLKRKIRDRLLEDGKEIFYQSDGRATDGHDSLKDRAEATLNLKASKREIQDEACKKFLDIRSFGAVMSYKGKSKTEKGISVGITGAVTIQPAESVSPVSITTLDITKSVNNEKGETKNAKGSDTMGSKHFVEEGVYAFFGGINAYTAERNSMTTEDVESIKSVLPRMFENDESAARPHGSMRVLNVIWWDHGNKAGSVNPGRLFESLSVKDDGSFDLVPIEGISEPEIVKGF